MFMVDGGSLAESVVIRKKPYIVPVEWENKPIIAGTYGTIRYGRVETLFWRAPLSRS